MYLVWNKVLTNLKEKVGAEVLESHKELSQLNDMVNDLPNIKKYIKARPKTDIWNVKSYFMSS